MWMGRGYQNQWPADDFTRSLDRSLAEDVEWAERQDLTMEEFRANYLFVLLGLVPPAGHA